MARRLLSLLLGLPFFIIVGCASKPPMLRPPQHFERQGWIPAFTGDDWQTVLGKVVSDGGYVHWDILQSSPATRDALSRYVSLVSQVSPENRPDLFQTRYDRLAYWIDAYNACCMYGVLLRNLNNPPELYSVDHFSFGGTPLTLDQVEEQKIRPLGEARAVFAINRCTHSSPPLRREPYQGLTLGAQLADQGKTFLSDSRAVVLEGETAHVNPLVSVKYAADLQAAYQQKFGRTGTLLETIRPYAMKHSLLWDAKRVVPMEYDASLNRP
jgi:hypothetical protein